MFIVKIEKIWKSEEIEKIAKIDRGNKGGIEDKQNWKYEERRYKIWDGIEDC